MKEKNEIRATLFWLLALLILGVGCNQPDAGSKSSAQPDGPVEKQLTRLGEIPLESGYPSEASIKKLYDERDFQRACQVHNWALPMVGFHALHLAQRDQIGVKDGDVAIYLDLADKKGMLTPNITTLYAFTFWDLSQKGPMVVDAPAGLIAGGVLDLWQQPITDVGQTGPDKGAGGKYLILPPGSKDVVAPGYRVFKSPTVQIWFGTRGLDSDPVKAQATVRNHKIFAWNNRANPEPTNYVLVNGKAWTSAHPTDVNYFRLVSEALMNEPVQTRDRIMQAMLTSLGIEKGKPFQPDERLTKIFNEAAVVGELTARANAYEKRYKGAKVWDNKKWEYANLVELNQEDSNYTQLDERASWFYEAIGNSAGMQGRVLGFGQAYIETAKDKAGNWLVGSKNYRIHIPADVPARQFWSITLYDNVTRYPLVTDQGSADISSRKDIDRNSDGSVDVYFGPSKPEGSNRNYIKTLSGKGWFPYFRFYAPSEAYFDKTWKLEDIEEIK